METSELIEIISRGEDSKHQFKESRVHQDTLVQEMVALSNSEGGQIFFGVTNNCEVEGLTADKITQERLNNKISNAAEAVKPSIYVKTENIRHPHGIVIVITVPVGFSIPYMTNDGQIFIKNDADKRKITAREEIQRMFQKSGLLHGDEAPTNGITTADIDREYFNSFIKKEYGEDLEKSEMTISRILENFHLADNDILNVAGALLFSKNPQYRLPSFIVKAVTYPGNSIDENSYISSDDITGKIADIYQKTFNYITSNLIRLQGNQGVNSTGKLEIPPIVLEELLVNALVHRDYFISATIRVFIFSDRIEIISPGHLPNNLTIENIKSGVSNIRNPVLASFSSKLLPYRGLGNGIRRSLQSYPKIEFIDDRQNNLFVSKILRY